MLSIHVQVLVFVGGGHSNCQCSHAMKLIGMDLPCDKQNIQWPFTPYGAALLVALRKTWTSESHCMLFPTTVNSAAISLGSMWGLLPKIGDSSITKVQGAWQRNPNSENCPQAAADLWKPCRIFKARD